MINGNIDEFINCIHYGEELWFTFNGETYFLEGMTVNEKNVLFLYEMKDDGFSFEWEVEAGKPFPAEEFLAAKIWNGKNFLEIEADVRWTDTELG